MKKRKNSSLDNFAAHVKVPPKNEYREFQRPYLFDTETPYLKVYPFVPSQQQLDVKLWTGAEAVFNKSSQFVINGVALPMQVCLKTSVEL